MKKVAILGSSGSIGQNALSVVANHPDAFRVAGLAANTSVALMEQQVRQFQPRYVAMYQETAAQELKERLRDVPDVEVLTGLEGLIAVATMDEADLVLEAIGGGRGLIPTLKAIEAGKDLAFVNKEVLVMGGPIVTEAVKKHQTRLLPVDSEISAIFQCLSDGFERREIGRLILTASGGPFRETPVDHLTAVTPEQALKHPNWDMGPKITVDSATMMNKGLEVIESCWFFDMAVSQIEVLIHPESIIHSMVEFVDGSVLAQLGVSDMRLPIQYALTYPKRLPSPATHLNFAELQALHFEPVDFEKFPCLKLAYTAAEVGGTLPTILSSADEVVVRAFLEGEIGFMDIPAILSDVIAKHDVKQEPGLDDILEADEWAKAVTKQFIKSRR